MGEAKLNKKDQEVLRVAQQYVVKLHQAKQGDDVQTQRDDLWRAFWNHEGTILAIRKGKS
jgi:hypothetical protein